MNQYLAALSAVLLSNLASLQGCFLNPQPNLKFVLLLKQPLLVFFLLPAYLLLILHLLLDKGSAFQDRVQGRCCFPGELSVYWKVQFGVDKKFRFATFALSLCKKTIVVDKNYLVVDKILGLESVQLQEVPEQGDIPVLHCVMKNCLVAFHILLKNREKEY